MKVYVVTDGMYSDYHIEAVFTDRLQAELYCATHHANYIEEYDADEHKFESDKEPKIEWTAEFWRFKGEVSHSVSQRYTIKDTKSVVVRKGNVIVTVSLDKNISKKKAEKILLDMYAQWKYEQYEESKKLLWIRG